MSVSDSVERVPEVSHGRTDKDGLTKMNSPSDINSRNATPAGGHNESTSSQPVSPDLSVPAPLPNPSTDGDFAAVDRYIAERENVSGIADELVHRYGSGRSVQLPGTLGGDDRLSDAASPVVSSSRAVDLDLDQIEARANAATAGSWGLSSSEATMNDRSSYRFGPRSQPPVFLASQMRFADAEFIAHAREDVPRLVAEVRRLREDRSRYLEGATYNTSRAEVAEAERDAARAEAERLRAGHDPACESLRGEYDRTMGDLAVAVAEAARVREALQAVRELHRPKPATRVVDERCSICHWVEGDVWPCATVRALDAALDGEQR